MTRDSPWTLRAFESGDEAGLSHLFERSFNRRRTSKHWRWKLQTQCSPVATSWLAVDEHSAPIFHYGGIPRKIETESRLAMISVDGMTDPGFQRRGLLTSCGRQIFDQWASAGVDFTLGLPNERWGSRLNALGWRYLFPLRWHVRPLRPEITLARRLDQPGIARFKMPGRFFHRLCQPSQRVRSSFEITEIKRADDSFDKLWQSCRPESCRLASQFVLSRGKAWVDWRYFDHPEHHYRGLTARRDGHLVGYLIYRLEEGKTQKLGYVAEVVTAPAQPSAARALIYEAMSRLLQQETVNAFALAIPGSRLSRELRRSGFVFSHGSFGVHCVPFAQDLDLEAMADPSQWQLQGGDFDII